MLTYKSVAQTLQEYDQMEEKLSEATGKVKLLQAQRDSFKKKFEELKESYEAQKSINDAMLDVLCDLFNGGRELNDVY